MATTSTASGASSWPPSSSVSARSLLGQRAGASTGAPHPSLAKLARSCGQAVAAATTVAAPVVTAASGTTSWLEGWAALVTGAPAQSIGGGTSK